MIVIGTDTHKQSHTAAALEEGTGRLLAEQTVRAKRRSFDDLLLWGRYLDSERVWAIEDCRHVSGALERFLLARGERVVRVAPKLTADKPKARAAAKRCDASSATSRDASGTCSNPRQTTRAQRLPRPPSPFTATSPSTPSLDIGATSVVRTSSASGVRRHARDPMRTGGLRRSARCVAHRLS